MSLFQVSKPKSAAKIMIPPTDALSDVTVKTVNYIAKMVSSTLGPGGRQVLIERPEMNMAPIITKDGVTVAKHLGFDDSVQQLILEAVRDSSLKTASIAGDGTTTATILSAAITSQVTKMVKEHKKISPQKIVRELENLVPYIKERINSYKLLVNSDNYDELLLKVATLSANGDVELANKILEAFNIVGEEGNMTIVEMTGDSKYEVERINGYTVESGFEENLKNFSQGFINDKSGTMVIQEKPVFVLYDGVITDIMQIFDGITKIANYFSSISRAERGVILVSHGFSETVLATLYENWNHPKAEIKVYPLVTPQNALINSRTDFLFDLKAYTGSPIFNPMDKPFIDVNPEDLEKTCRVTYFEAGRFKTSIIAKEDSLSVELRVEELKERLKNPESQYEARDLEVRIGKLTSGIARLKIYSPTAGASREQRDRADDSWCSVRSAIKEGAVPGGGFVLVKLASDFMNRSDKEINSTKKIALQILGNALLVPVRTLYENYGYNEEEIKKQIWELLNNNEETYDISEQKWVPKFDLLDSVSAVSESIKNSINIASLLGSLGGIISFKRDITADEKEREWARNIERAIEG